MLLVLGSLLFIVFLSNVELVIIQVEEGYLRGTIQERITGNGKYYSFKGIPYAAPPVGELRFRAPQPPLTWDGVRCASTYGSVCPQMELSTKIYTPGNEDCLFLNVYTPTMKPKSPLAVMFFIHDGGLISGSGNDDKYKPDFLLDQNVILVTINYRLGALGFLSLDIDEVPGNAGFKDQVAAMKWVKKNIARFGGDPDNVTIFGDTVGGVSVTLHCLSPLSKGLFKRAITNTGVFLIDYVIPFEPKRRALLFTQQLGFYTKDPKEAFYFLQNATVQSLITTTPFVLFYEKPSYDLFDMFPFTPVIEKICDGQNFLTEDPQRLLIAGKTNNVDIILGNRVREGENTVESQKEYILKYYPIYKEFLVPLKISNVRSPKLVLKLADRIEKYYFGNKKISNETMEEIKTFFSYFLFICDIHRFVEMWVKTGNKAYFYEISAFSEKNSFGENAAKNGLKEDAQLDDLPFVFGGQASLSPLDKSKPAYKVIVQICTVITNYAKYGNPTPDNSLGVTWTDYSKNNSYLDLGLQLTPKHYDNRPHIDFWRSIYNSARIKFS